MRVAIATVLVAFTLVLAGCPGTDGGSGAEPAAEQEDGAGTLDDNDAGAEPVNPQNGTDAAGNGTEEAAVAGANESANDTANDTGNATGADGGGDGA